MTVKMWSTQLKAIDPSTGELATYMGDNIEAPTLELAQEICNTTGRGYLTVIGQLIAEIDEETGERIDYDNFLNN